MKIVISSGHGLYIRGASSSPRPPYLDEVDEARRVVNRVAELWKQSGVGVDVFHDNTSTTQNANLNAIVNYHNSRTRDRDVSVHFNAYQKYSAAQKPNGMGTECLYVTQQTLATQVANAMATSGTLINRGAKYRSDLFFLNNTAKPAILLEVCFVDAEVDGNKYRANFERMCVAIAEAISGVRVPTEPTEPPVEPPTEPPVEPPTEPETPTGANHLDLTVAGTGNFTVILNGEAIAIGAGSDTNQVAAAISYTGDVTISVNGQDFQNFRPAAPEEGPQDNHKNITATVFGGTSDPNNSAYPPYDPLNDTELYVALPANVADADMRSRGVQVWNPTTGQNAVAKVRDKGPWTVDDDPYVFGDAIAVAVTCYANRTPLPSGPNKGKVPTNDAAIDLSPALARAVGISGKGKVDWDWV